MSCATDYYKKHPEYNRRKSREWRAANPEKVKAIKDKRRYADYLTTCKRKYGITQQEFEAMLESQGQKCVICRLDLDFNVRDAKPNVDHCHKSGYVRGILCGKCNSMLGYSQDDVSILEAAIIYLGGN